MPGGKAWILQPLTGVVMSPNEGNILSGTWNNIQSIDQSFTTKFDVLWLHIQVQFGHASLMNTLWVGNLSDFDFSKIVNIIYCAFYALFCQFQNCKVFYSSLRHEHSFPNKHCWGLSIKTTSSKQDSQMPQCRNLFNSWISAICTPIDW